jgi:hypothetical protein
LWFVYAEKDTQFRHRFSLDFVNVAHVHSLILGIDPCLFTLHKKRLHHLGFASPKSRQPLLKGNRPIQPILSFPRPDSLSSSTG